MSPDLQKHLQIALELTRVEPLKEMPVLFGKLEEIRATAQMRLLEPPAPESQDTLLDIRSAAALLGVGRDYLYRHHSEFPFVRRMGKRLLFSRRGIERWISERK